MEVSSQQGLPLVEEEMLDMADDRRCAESCLSWCAGFAAGGGMRLLARLDRDEVGKVCHVKRGQSPLVAPVFNP